MTWPSRDHCIPQSGKQFVEGEWRTPEAAKRKRNLKQAARCEEHDPEFAEYLRGERAWEDLTPLGKLVAL
jgi:hypothetical protein